MSELQKAQFAERLSRISKQPGNGRLVTPGAVDIFEDERKIKKRQASQPKVKKKAYRKPRGGVAWFFGLTAGFVMFVVWMQTFPELSRPDTWSLANLPVPAKEAGIWIGGIVFTGMLVLWRATLRTAFLIVVGMLCSAIALSAVAAFVPGLGSSLTTPEYSARMQAMAIEILSDE